MGEHLRFPSVWGCPDLPRVPPQWVRSVSPNLDLGVATSAKSGTRRPVTLARLASAATLKLPPEDLVAALDMALSHSLLDMPRTVREQPFLNGFAREVESFGAIPLLEASRELLDLTGLGGRSLGVALTECSTFDLLSLLRSTGDPRWALVAVDLATTASEWTDFDAGFRAVVPLPLLPLGQLAKELLSVRAAAAGVNLSDRALRGLKLRFGVSGAPSTLQVAGDAAGLARERIRQLETQILCHPIGGNRKYPLWFLDKLDARFETGLDADAILVELNDGEPFSKAAFDQLLGLAGMSADDLAPRAKELSVQGAGWVSEETQQQRDRAREIEAVAKRLAGRIGFTTVAAVVENFDGQLDVGEVGSALELTPHWYLLAGGWIYYQPRENRTVPNKIRLMLAAFGDGLPVDHVIEGLRRFVAGHSYPELPPRTVVREAFAQLDSFVLEGEVLRSSDLLPRLSERTLDLDLFELVASTPEGAMHRSEIFENLVEQGYKNSSITHYLSYSPLVRRCGDGVYAGVGFSVDARTVEAISERARSALVPGAIVFEVVPGGVVMKATVSSTLFNTSVVSPPKHVQVALGQASYRFVGESGEDVGVMSLIPSGKALLGIHHVFQHFDVRPGDSIELEFTRESQIARGRKTS